MCARCAICATCAVFETSGMCGRLGVQEGVLSLVFFRRFLITQITSSFRSVALLSSASTKWLTTSLPTLRRTTCSSCACLELIFALGTDSDRPTRPQALRIAPVARRTFASSMATFAAR